MILADLDPARPHAVADRLGDARFSAVALDASDERALASALRELRVDAVLNATDPRFNPQIFAAALAAGCTYLDMALTLSGPGVRLGDAQFAVHEAWVERGQLALVGIGVEPGLSDVFACFASDHLFAEIDVVAVRDGAELVLEGYE